MVCGVCWRVYDWNVGVESATESWTSLDDLVTRKALALEDYLLSDGYCPECAAGLLLHSSPITPPPPYFDQTVGTFAS